MAAELMRRLSKLARFDSGYDSSSHHGRQRQQKPRRNSRSSSSSSSSRSRPKDKKKQLTRQSTSSSVGEDAIVVVSSASEEDVASSTNSSCRFESTEGEEQPIDEAVVGSVQQDEHQVDQDDRQERHLVSIKFALLLETGRTSETLLLAGIQQDIQGTMQARRVADHPQARRSEEDDEEEEDAPRGRRQRSSDIDNEPESDFLDSQLEKRRQRRLAYKRCSDW